MRCVFFVYTLDIYPINNLIKINTITPGIPKIPIVIDVNKFKPTWNPKLAPTKLITYINIPPNIEFKTNFNIFLIGNINILPIKKIKQIHAKKVIIFWSKIITSKKDSKSYYYLYELFRTNITYTASFSFSILILISFILSNTIPLDFATLIK